MPRRHARNHGWMEDGSRRRYLDCDRRLSVLPRVQSKERADVPPEPGAARHRDDDGRNHEHRARDDHAPEPANGDSPERRGRAAGGREGELVHGTAPAASSG